MKGNAKVVDALNRALAIELTAINQYFVQAKMCENWGFRKLAGKHYAESMGEMRHAEKLIERIIFLEGVPTIHVNPGNVGREVKAQLESDLKLESTGVKTYNEIIALCQAEGDAGSRETLEHILVDSEGHVDWLESQLHVIEQVGLPRYLAEQLGGEEKKG